MLSNFHEFVPLYEQLNYKLLYKQLNHNHYLKDFPDFIIIHENIKFRLGLTTYNTEQFTSCINGTYTNLHIDINFDDKLCILQGFIGCEYYKFDELWNEKESLDPEIQLIVDMISNLNIISLSKFSQDHLNPKITSIYFRSLNGYNEKLNYPVIFGKTSYLSLSMCTKDINFYYKYLFYLILIGSYINVK